MSRFGRRRAKADENLGQGAGDDLADFPSTSEVTIVKPAPADHSDVLAELSAAFRAGHAHEHAGVIEDDDSDDPTTPTASTGTTRQPDPTVVPRTIAIGGDDGLPDAVYLDDALEGADPSDTVFIDDDGTGDALLPKEATRRGIEPRLRQRRIGVRRAEGRRRLRKVLVIGGVFVVLVGVLAVLGSPLFAIEDVQVSGKDRADDAAVTAVVDDLVGTPVLRADTAEAERRLELIPWVESARVRTDFPNGASIELLERTAVATAAGSDGRYRILDRQGRVLDVIAGQPVDFVLITGPPVDLEPGAFAGVGHSAAAALVTKFRDELRTRLVSISTSSDGSDLRVILTNQPLEDIEVRLGAAISDQQQIERLVRLELVLDELGESGSTVIDVSTNETTEL